MDKTPLETRRVVVMSDPRAGESAPGVVCLGLNRCLAFRQLQRCHAVISTYPRVPPRGIWTHWGVCSVTYWGGMREPTPHRLSVSPNAEHGCKTT